MCLLTFGEYVKDMTNEMNVQHHKIQSKYCLSHMQICEFEVLTDACDVTMPNLIWQNLCITFYLFIWTVLYQSKRHTNDPKISNVTILVVCSWCEPHTICRLSNNEIIFIKFDSKM